MEALRLRRRRVREHVREVGEHDLIDVFGSRLREPHVSAIDAHCTHLPLDAASIELYASLTPSPLPPYAVDPRVAAADLVGT
jgi:hypothetical protein